MKKIQIQKQLKRARVQSRAASFNFHKMYLTLLFAFFAFLALYLYFVFASIYYTSLAKNTQLELSTVNSDIASLEADYVAYYESVRKSDKTNSYLQLAEAEKDFVKRDAFLGRAN